MISLTTDFECGHGKNIEKLGEDRFRLEVDGDKQQGYSGGYCFDLINEGPAAEVTVELREDSKWGGPTGFGVAFPTTTWIKPVGFHRFRPLRGQYPEWVEGGLTLRVPVEQGQRLRVSMTYVAPYSEISENLREFAAQRTGRCELFSVGKSVQGREILGLRAGTPGRPKVFCVAGQHPHEHAGVWGVLGIADFMSSLLPEAERLRDRLDVVAVPIVNPDGNVAGRSAFNAERLDMYLAFGETPDAEEPEAHESRLLWRWIGEERPALWLNFHCYTGWQLNSEYPFEGWYEVEDHGLFRDPGQRRLYEALCDTLRLETDAPSTHERASIHRPTTLCYQMARRYGIPHAFYELNNGTSGKHAATLRALNVFRRVVNTLLHHTDTGRGVK
ncbi:MAG: hypothetical protein EXS64_14120 [Candidatus Latescibacteria bacterium]|nr:hypothetical protein [Candidatus Latescibacterota bacterium]